MFKLVRSTLMLATRLGQVLSRRGRAWITLIDRSWIHV